MNRLIWTEDGENFTIRDRDGMLRCPAPEDTHKFASDKEVRAARARFESAQTPLPQFDPITGLYYWNDIDDQWSEEECKEDVLLLWPGMDADLLLLSSRLMAKLGIVD